MKIDRSVFVESGRKGGKARVPKGFAKLSAEERKAASRRGVEARRKKRRKRK